MGLMKVDDDRHHFTHGQTGFSDPLDHTLLQQGYIP
jgi:hypothetical protein